MYVREIHDPLDENYAMEDIPHQTYGFFFRTQLKIYKLYIEGWKISELSKKFGATP